MQSLIHKRRAASDEIYTNVSDIKETVTKIQNAQRRHKPRIFFTISRVDFSRIFRPMSNYTKIKVTLLNWLYLWVLFWYLVFLKKKHCKAIQLRFLLLHYNLRWTCNKYWRKKLQRIFLTALLLVSTLFISS